MQLSGNVHTGGLEEDKNDIYGCSERQQEASRCDGCVCTGLDEDKCLGVATPEDKCPEVREEYICSMFKMQMSCINRSAHYSGLNLSCTTYMEN